jgi:O-antigen biosynthesis protein
MGASNEPNASAPPWQAEAGTGHDPAVSFLVPVFNRLDLTRALVDGLRATVTGVAWEAIIVDDASTDGTAALLDALGPPFQVIRLPGNRGFAPAVNRAAALARGPVLGLLNNDLVLRRGWLEPMLRLLREAPRAGAVGNIQVNPATGLIDHAGVFFDLEGMPTHAHKHRRRPPPGPWRERNAATGACLLVPRRVFAEMGGLCEDFRNGMEDIDLCVRLRAAGYHIYVSHESVVGHHVSSSPGRHEANQANTELFRRRCAALAAPWGREEWPIEYLRRYARRWWRIDPARAWLALRMLLRRRQKPVA